MHIKTIAAHSLITLLLYGNCLGFAYAQSFVTENDRPERSWIEQFHNAKKVFVINSINEALMLCPKNLYCELMVPTLTLSGTVSVNRSRTKFTGLNGNIVRMLDNANGFFFQIEQGTTEVMFTNLNINGGSIERNPDTFGIGAYGSSISKVAIINNTFQSLYGKDNAHAIALYGTGKDNTDTIEHVIIDSNRIKDMRTGSSESIAINGNVRHWEIINNNIRDINNIAIDAIGGEGTAPVQVLSDGRVAPGLFDAARLGFIQNNTVVGLSTKSNPAYGNQESWAAAIYIDGAHSINVSGNTVSHVPWGLEIGAENCVDSSFVQMFNNNSSHTLYGDILIGGYSDGGYLNNLLINCDPHESDDHEEGHGYVSRVDVRDNQLNGNRSETEAFIGTTVLQHRINRSTIEPPTSNLND